MVKVFPLCGSHACDKFWYSGQEPVEPGLELIPRLTCPPSQLMAEWQGRLRSNCVIQEDLNMDTKEAETAFKLSLQESLLDPIIAEQ